MRIGLRGGSDRGSGAQAVAADTVRQPDLGTSTRQRRHTQYMHEHGQTGKHSIGTAA